MKVALKFLIDAMKTTQQSCLESRYNKIDPGHKCSNLSAFPKKICLNLRSARLKKVDNTMLIEKFPFQKGFVFYKNTQNAP